MYINRGDGWYFIEVFSTWPPSSSRYSRRPSRQWAHRVARCSQQSRRSPRASWADLSSPSPCYASHCCWTRACGFYGAYGPASVCADCWCVSTWSWTCATENKVFWAPPVPRNTHTSWSLEHRIFSFKNKLKQNNNKKEQALLESLRVECRPCWSRLHRHQHRHQFCHRCCCCCCY